MTGFLVSEGCSRAWSGEVEVQLKYSGLQLSGESRGMWSAQMLLFSGASCQPDGIILCVLLCFLVGLRPWGGGDAVKAILPGFSA